MISLEGWTFEEETEAERAVRIEKEYAAKCRAEAALKASREPDVYPRGSVCGVVADIDDSEFYDDQSGEPVYTRISITCPGCQRRLYPFRSRRTQCYATGYRWVALEYREHYALYLARCPHCRARYRLMVYTPQ